MKGNMSLTNYIVYAIIHRPKGILKAIGYIGANDSLSSYLHSLYGFFFYLFIFQNCIKNGYRLSTKFRN